MVKPVLAKSLVAVLLSLPTAIVMVGIFIVATPFWPSLRFPAILMVFPLWLVLVWASYLVSNTRVLATALITVSLCGYAMIQLIKLAQGSAL